MSSAERATPMVATRPMRRPLWQRFDTQLLPLTVTIGLFLAMLGYGSLAYSGFLSAQVLLNLLIDNAVLLIVAVGMTFVILAGGMLNIGVLISPLFSHKRGGVLQEVLKVYNILMKKGLCMDRSFVRHAASQLHGPPAVGQPRQGGG